MDSRKWVLRTIAFSLAALVIIAAVAFLFDPFMQYRVTDYKYFLRSRYVNPGIIKNYPYDTVVIGSSMMQNFNMQSFRDKLDCDPIKVTIGGISMNEILELIGLINRQNKAQKMYMSTDLYLLNSISATDRMRIPRHLLDDNFINDYKYLLGYETWMRFIPVNIVINAMYLLGMDIPDKIYQSTDIDYIEYWNDDFTFGEDIVINYYLRTRNSVAVADNDNDYVGDLSNVNALYDRMVLRFNEFAETIDTEKEYVFYFSPYSALFWYQAKKDGYFDIYQDVKIYMINILSEMGNVTVHDFQSMPSISDLSIYKDLRHYNAQINEYMIDCFANGDYIVDAQTIVASIEKLRALVTQFEQENSSWLD